MVGEPWPVAVAGLPRCGELLSGSHGHRWYLPATVSTVAVPTTPLFSKKLSNSSSAASMDASTPEPLPGRAGVSLAPGELGPSLVLPGAGCAALLRAPGEKRKLPESLTLEDAKRIRVMGDIPMELVNEVMLTITDPAAMLGPEVRSGGH